jgi:hypothetical protein
MFHCLSDNSMKYGNTLFILIYFLERKLILKKAKKKFRNINNRSRFKVALCIEQIKKDFLNIVLEKIITIKSLQIVKNSCL